MKPSSVLFFFLILKWVKRFCFNITFRLDNRFVLFLIWFHRQFPLYHSDIRWQQPNPNPAGPYLAYPIVSAQPPVSTEYTYYQLMPAPCAQVMGFYHPFPAPYSNTFQAANTVNTITTECTERPNQLGQVFPLSSHRSRNSNRGPVPPKVSDWF